MQYTQFPTDTFSKLQLNAGIFTNSFDTSTATVGDILFATTGGASFEATPNFIDFGEDIDNCPKNTKEYKRIDDYDVKISGTALTVTPTLAAKYIGAADVDSTDTTKVTPRAQLDADKDFADDLWWIGDYSDENDGTTAGYLAIHILNALSTGGFKVTSKDKEKGQFPFEFTGHYSADDMDTVPFEVYIKTGTASA